MSTMGLTISKQTRQDPLQVFIFFNMRVSIEYGIFGEGSQISNNQMLENTVFLNLIAVKIFDPSPKIPYSINVRNQY